MSAERRSTRQVLIAIGAALTVGAASCGGDTTSPSSSPATAVVTTSTRPASTVPVTTVPVTTVPVTTTAPLATPAPPTTTCDPFGSLDEVAVEFPMLLSSAVGADIRTGAHACFERIVIELSTGPTATLNGLPGYWVRYATGPVTLGQTDDQFIELAGDADLLITLGVWMFTFGENGDAVGYSGPTDITPTNVTAIQQMYLIDNWEGMHTWAVGLDRARAFRVTTLTDPDRLVVDIAR